MYGRSLPLGNVGGVQTTVRWLEPRSATVIDATALGTVHSKSRAILFSTHLPTLIYTKEAGMANRHRDKKIVMPRSQTPGPNLQTILGQS